MPLELYEFLIDELNGERGYSYTEYVWAENLDQAYALAREFAGTFYDDTETEPYEEDSWTTYEISWRLDYVRKCEEIRVYPTNGVGFSLPVKSYQEAKNDRQT
jgi:hypothetical protein